MVDKEQVCYDDFAKIDLKIGTIKEAAAHPKADRLLVLQVDVGEDEPRQIVAGVREHYEPEGLVGTQIVVITNLAPVVLRGVESNGMLLAATSGENVVLLSPRVECLPGSPAK